MLAWSHTDLLLHNNKQRPQVTLSPDLLLVSFITIATLVALASNRFPSDFTLLGAAGLLLVSSILTPAEALVGFSNPGIVTIAALYVVVGGLEESGSVAWLSRSVLGRPKRLSVAMFRLIVPAAIFSAFANNSPVVAMFTKAVQSWCKRSGFKASQLLLPLSYASILGGTCTLIGTSTNLVVDGLLRQSGHEGFSLFELAWLGVPLTLLGCAYLLLFSRYLLPNRESASETFDQFREYLVEMRVDSDCELIDQTVEEAGLRHLPGLYLVEIGRGNEVIPVSPHTQIHADDQLVFAGAVESVVELRHIKGLVSATTQTFKLTGDQQDRRLFEAVLAGASPTIGKSIRESRFRHRYNAAVLSVARNGKRLEGKIGEIILQAGDTLLLEAQKGFLFKYRNSREFLLVSRLSNSVNVRHERAPFALAIIAAMLCLVGFNVIELLQGAIISASLMLLSGCLSLEQARKSIDFRVLLIIACAFALGAAIQKVGLASLVAENALSLANSNPLTLLIIVYVMTVLLTETITNNAAAIIMFPIAFSAANAMGLSPTPFAVAVMIAASASFITPIGYQTNLMVQGPGGYRFSDYVRLGLPLSLLIGASAVSLIPFIWSF